MSNPDPDAPATTVRGRFSCPEVTVADLWSQVYPNLLASLIWAVPGGLAHWHTRRRLKQHRADLAELHAKHDALHQQIKDGTP